jgi:hypothetical protein
VKQEQEKIPHKHMISIKEWINYTLNLVVSGVGVVLLVAMAVHSPPPLNFIFICGIFGWGYYVLSKGQSLSIPITDKIFKYDEGSTDEVTEINASGGMEKKILESKNRNVEKLGSENQKSRNNNRTIDSLSRDKYVSFLRSKNYKEFEKYISKIMENSEYYTERTRYTNDGGYDIFAERIETKYLVECKKYERDTRVGRPDVMKLVGAMAGENIEYGIIVSSGFFTKEAKKYSKKTSVTLINCNKINDIMSEIERRLKSGKDQQIWAPVSKPVPLDIVPHGMAFRYNHTVWRRVNPKN